MRGPLISRCNVQDECLYVAAMDEPFRGGGRQREAAALASLSLDAQAPTATEPGDWVKLNVGGTVWHSLAICWEHPMVLVLRGALL